MKCVARMAILSIGLLSACVAGNQASPPKIAVGGQANVQTLNEKHGTELVGSAVRGSSSISAGDVIDAPDGSGAATAKRQSWRG